MLQLPKKITTIDQYIVLFPENIQEVLKKIHKLIKKNAPGAEEKISYQMPTFKLKENLVHFAVCKEHIGFYPTPSAIIAFKKELKAYKTSKGAVQFPLDKAIPYDLIEKVVKYRVKEVLKKKLKSA